jgi:hypothetical protein
MRKTCREEAMEREFGDVGEARKRNTKRRVREGEEARG